MVLDGPVGSLQVPYVGSLTCSFSGKPATCHTSLPPALPPSLKSSSLTLFLLSLAQGARFSFSCAFLSAGLGQIRRCNILLAPLVKCDVSVFKSRHLKNWPLQNMEGLLIGMWESTNSCVSWRPLFFLKTEQGTNLPLLIKSLIPRILGEKYVNPRA